jgi:hypothetical protein
MPARATCPCCGCRTLSSGPGAYEICAVCRWEDDGTPDGPLAEDGPNGISLVEAQRRFERYGAAHLDDAPDEARPPLPDEARDPGWQPDAGLGDEDAAPRRDLGLPADFRPQEALPPGPGGRFAG